MSIDQEDRFQKEIEELRKDMEIQNQTLEYRIEQAVENALLKNLDKMNEQA